MDRYTKPVDTASFVFLSFLFRIWEGNLTGDVVSREIQRVSIYIYSLRFPRGGCEKPSYRGSIHSFEGNRDSETEILEIVQ